MRIFKTKHVHPDTGDVLTTSEMISWKVQDSIRNWWFVLGWTVLTAIWLKWPWLFFDDKVYTKWLMFASWLAVTVELIVAIALVGQTKRDAQIIRHILKLEKRELEHIEDLLENKDNPNNPTGMV